MRTMLGTLLGRVVLLLSVLVSAVPMPIPLLMQLVRVLRMMPLLLSVPVVWVLLTLSLTPAAHSAALTLTADATAVEAVPWICGASEAATSIRNPTGSKARGLRHGLHPSPAPPPVHSLRSTVQ